MRALITGASRGLGRALSTVLLAQGHDVLAGTRRASSNVSLGASSVLLDVTDQQSIQDAAARWPADTWPLDLLVNNAGVYNADGTGYDPQRPSQQLGTLNPADALQIYHSNTVGALLVTQAFRPALTGRQRPGGPLVVNISSRVASLENAQEAGDYYYAPSKAALNMVTRRLAVDLSTTVTVVAVDPGWLRTGAGGPRATGDPAQAAAELARLIQGLTTADTGRFLSLNGADIAF